MKLRDYQEEAIVKLRVCLGTGKRRPVLQSPTGSGKTVLAAAVVKMAREKGKRVLFCVPALSLIDQTVERFRENGIHDIGVIQGMHEMTDYRQPVQVCSVQTLARRKIPAADLVIIDECHVRFKLYDKWMNLPEWQTVPFIGLTATPWAKGMGTIWDDLIIGITTAKLIESGSLSDFKVYAPAHPDLSNVKTVLGDYEAKGLGEAMNQGSLVADIVSTWLERGKNSATIAFCVNRIHAKNVQQQFVEAGVAAEYMDAYTDIADRNDIVSRFAAGVTKIICNVGVLTTGFDADVRCIILARPTKSEILYTQMFGRGLRTAEGKECLIVLDHSDTTLRLGFVTDIHHDTLDMGVKASAAPRKAPLPKECPKCAFVKPVKVHECPSCGFKPEASDKTQVTDGELYEITKGKAIKKDVWSWEGKQRFYSELIFYAKLRGYKSGWAYWAYRDKFKEPPNRSLLNTPARDISPETSGWITSRNIRQAKSKKRGAGA